MKYKTSIVTAWLKEIGLPEPVYEYRFHPPRKWRFDLAWPKYRIALEVQGAIFSGGRHVRGATLKKEHEKLNAAARTGWRVMFCIPQELCMMETAQMIKDAMSCEFRWHR